MFSFVGAENNVTYTKEKYMYHPGVIMKWRNGVLKMRKFEDISRQRVIREDNVCTVQFVKSLAETSGLNIYARGFICD